MTADDRTGTRAELAVAQTIVESALAGERVVSVVRVALCVAVGARAAYYWAATSVAAGHEAERAWITYPALACAIGFSIAVLAGAGRGRPARLLHLSVAIDAAVCFVALFPNALWPGPGYLGTPYVLDTAVILILTMATGLRHSVSAVLLGGLLNAASYAGLAITDHVVSDNLTPLIVAAHVMYGIMLGAAIAVAAIIAARTRRLAERAGHAAVAADQAGHGLRSLIHDHHDLRSVIASAQLNADLIARGPDSGATVDHLRDDLDELRRQLDRVKGRAIEELASLEGRQPAALGDAAADVVRALAPRFPGIALDAAIDDGAAVVVVVGGLPTLRRILANLVINACEGDGARSASRVAIAARRTGARVAIEIADDGPGLPAHVLATPPGAAVSTKPAGIGLGIGIVDGLVRASGGTLELRDRPGGGASVIVELPAA